MIVAVTLPPALDSALVSLIAETWLNDQGRTAGGEGGDVAGAVECSTWRCWCR
jgi:hypothetical protein